MKRLCAVPAVDKTPSCEVSAAEKLSCELPAAEKPAPAPSSDNPAVFAPSCEVAAVERLPLDSGCSGPTAVEDGEGIACLGCLNVGAEVSI